MSKGLRSYPDNVRQEVIDRRLRSDTKGMGYWAAWDARHGTRKSVKADDKAKTAE